MGSENLIRREDAYAVLSEYYHHKTEIQHEALREALDRVPSATQTNAPNVLNALDCVSRQAAIEVIEKMMEVYWDRKVVLARAWEQIKDLPPADIDLSDYSDRLWRNAYEQGKADAERNEIIDPVDLVHDLAERIGIHQLYAIVVDMRGEPERKKGKWLEREVIHAEEAKETITEWQSCKCSVCGRYHTQPYMYFFAEPHFCSWCGSEMKGEDDATD